MKVLTEDRKNIIAIPENSDIYISHLLSMSEEKEWIVFLDYNTERECAILARFNTEKEARDEIEFLFDALQNGKEFYEM